MSIPTIPVHDPSADTIPVVVPISRVKLWL